MSYIDRELLLIGVDGCISALHAQAKGDLVQEGAIKLVEATRDYIASLSAADVVEVRHGRWVPEVHHTYLPVEYDDAGYPALHEYISYRCSLCGREEAKKEPYCHCGARMDKEDEHEAG